MPFFSSDWDDEEEDDAFEGDLNALARDFERKSRDSFSARELIELFKYYSNQFPSAKGEFKADTYMRLILEQGLQRFPYIPVFAIHMAEWLIREKKYKKARKYIEQSLAYTPFEPTLIFMDSMIWGLQNEPDKALDALLNALNTCGDDEGLLEEVLDMLLHHKQYNLAMPVLERALELGAEVNGILEKYLENTDETGLMGALLPMIEKIVDQDPYSHEAWYVLGSAHMALREFEKALTALDYAVTIHENFADAWLAYFECLYESEKYSQLITHYNEQVQRFPKKTFQEIEGLLAWSYYETGDIKGSRALYKEVLKREPHDAECWYSMGLTYHYEGNYSAAIPYLEKAYDLDKFESDYGLVLASAYLGIESKDQWEPLYETLSIEHPNTPELWLDYSLAVSESGDRERALEIIEQGLQNNPSNPQLLYRMGALCYLCGHQPAAIFVLEKALEIAPEEHFLLFTFAPELKKATSILECILRFTTIRYE